MTFGILLNILDLILFKLEFNVGSVSTKKELNLLFIKL